MLAREKLGRRHQGGLPAGFDRRGHGKQRHDGLTAADIALQQPEHAVGIGEVGVDLRERARLRARQLEGKFGEDRLAHAAFRRENAAGVFAQALADHRKRELVGEELVVSHALPGGRGQREISLTLWRMEPREGFGEARPLLFRAPARVDPFGQRRETAKTLRDCFTQTRIGEAGRERIDGLQRRQCRIAIGVNDMIGMRHLHRAIVRLDLAGDQPLASFGQQTPQIAGVGLEIDELECARTVLHQHPIGRTLTQAASPPWPVLGHGDQKRGKRADAGVGDARGGRAVDGAHRQMPKQVDDTGMGGGVARRQKRVEQALDARADARKAPRRCEQGI